MIKKLKTYVMGRSRRNKIDYFYSLCGNSSKILDVGVTSNEHNSEVNLFLNEFKYADILYTGLAIESMSNIRKKHPNKRFVEYEGGG